MSVSLVPNIHISFKNCEQFWSYGGKVVALTRNILSAIALSSARVAPAIKPLRLFSIISVPFSLVDLTKVSKKVFNGVVEKNPKDIALNSLTFSLITADIFDSVTTFVNATLGLMTRSPILAGASLPLGFALSSMSLLSNSIKLLHGNPKERTPAILGITSSILAIHSLALFTIGPMTPLPYILLATATGLRLLAVTYQSRV